MHPANDRGVILRSEAGCILPADDGYPSLFQGFELRRGWAAPKTNVGIDPGRLIARRVFRVLKPDANREKARIAWRSIFPFRVGLFSARPECYCRDKRNSYRSKERSKKSQMSHLRFLSDA